MDGILKKLKDQLNCSVCLDTYNNPKRLQCNHIYCLKCLAKLIQEDQQRQLVVTCPKCRQVTPVPASGVADVQTAFRVNQLIEIVEEHKKITTVYPEEVLVSDSHRLPSHLTTVTCPEHGGKEVELYCETCEETICWECIMKGSRHHNHDYDKLDKAFVRYKEELLASLQPLEYQLATTNKTLEGLNGRCDSVTNQQATTKADIHSKITKLQEMLNVRKTELIGQLHQQTQAKLRSLAVQREQLETTQAQLSSCLLLMRKNLETSNHREALMMKRTTVKHVKKLTSAFQPDMPELSTENEMVVFSTPVDLAAQCKNYGRVYLSRSPEPSQLSQSSQPSQPSQLSQPSQPSQPSQCGKVKDAVSARKKSTTTLHVLNHNGQSCTTSISISDVAQVKTKGSHEKSVERRQSMVEIKGKHQLYIEVDGGQQVKEIPGHVSARSIVKAPGTPILTFDRVKRPVGVAIGQKGEVVVTEHDGHCATVFSPSGEVLQSLGTHGSGKGQLVNPMGVAVNNNGDILVADFSNHRVQLFAADGKILKEMRYTKQNSYPCGIHLSRRNGRMYVTNNGGCNILILNSDFSYCDAFGERGDYQGQFQNPQHIACDSSGNVYVADSTNHCVQVFTAEGKFLRMFRRRGEGMRELNGPTGVAIDSSDRVFVSEIGNHCISVFTSEGNFVMSFGSKGHGPGQFSSPHGLAVDCSGTLYVCDSNNNRVQVIQVFAH